MTIKTYIQDFKIMKITLLNKRKKAKLVYKIFILDLQNYLKKTGSNYVFEKSLHPKILIRSFQALIN